VASVQVGLLRVHRLGNVATDGHAERGAKGSLPLCRLVGTRAGHDGGEGRVKETAPLVMVSTGSGLPRLPVGLEQIVALWDLFGKGATCKGRVRHGESRQRRVVKLITVEQGTGPEDALYEGPDYCFHEGLEYSLVGVSTLRLCAFAPLQRSACFVSIGADDEVSLTVVHSDSAGRQQNPDVSVFSPLFGFGTDRFLRKGLRRFFFVLLQLLPVGEDAGPRSNYHTHNTQWVLASSIS